jgi:hypothetical protein
LEMAVARGRCDLEVGESPWGLRSPALTAQVVGTAVESDPDLLRDGNGYRGVAMARKSLLGRRLSPAASIVSSGAWAWTGALRRSLAGTRGRVRARPGLAGVATAAVALTLAAGAQASTVVETHTPFSMSFTNPCRGEEFMATGFAHSKTTFVESRSGTTLFSIESNLQDVKGVALMGVRYVVTETTTIHFLVDPDGGPNNNSLIFKMRFVRQGDDGNLVVGDDFYAYFHMQLTVNANGTMTANRFSSTSEPCQ